MISEIRDGHAWTKDDEETIKDLTLDEATTLVAWIQENFVPRKTANRWHTSYGLKHIFENSDGGFYVTNNQFKDAMLQAGFKPVEENMLNWYYRISERSPAFD